MAKTPQKVIVSEEVRDVTAPLPDGTVKILGSLISRIYEGENVQRHSFENAETSKEYSLGPTSQVFNFIDHTEAIQPLLDRDYKIVDQKIGRGGLHLWNVMEPAKPTRLKDPIKWDKKIWGASEVAQSKLTESLIAVTSVRPGRGFRFNRGFFRMVCSNGLVAEVLGLGSLKFNHVNFDPDRVDELFENEIKGVEMGPLVGTKAGLARFTQVLSDHLDGADPEDISFYVRRDLNPLLNSPRWWLSLFIEELEAFDQYGPQKVHALDLLNALTSPIALSALDEDPVERAEFRILGRVENYLESSARIIGVFSL